MAPLLAPSKLCARDCEPHNPPSSSPPLLPFPPQRRERERERERERASYIEKRALKKERKREREKRKKRALKKEREKKKKEWKNNYESTEQRLNLRGS
jgi:hypothetical protein